MNKLKVQQYDTAEDVLKVAREHGMGSRTAIYLALAYAYQWHLMSINNKSYMIVKGRVKLGHVGSAKVYQYG